jgi:hypothetical protein
MCASALGVRWRFIPPGIPAERELQVNDHGRDPMYRFKWVWSLCLLAGLVLAMPALAKPFTRMIDITQKAKVGNLVLTPGSYKLVVNGTEAKVMKDNKLLGEVNCHWIESAHKADYDEVIYDGDRLSEVRMAGKTRTLEFQ